MRATPSKSQTESTLIASTIKETSIASVRKMLAFRIRSKEDRLAKLSIESFAHTLLLSIIITLYRLTLSLNKSDHGHVFEVLESRFAMSTSVFVQN